MDAAHEEAYWLSAIATDEKKGSLVYYKSTTQGNYHAIIHSLMPPTVDIACEQWHENDDGELEKYTVIERQEVTLKQLRVRIW